MKLETKRRLGAFLGYPLTFLLGLLDKDEWARKETKEHQELFKDRIFGKRLK